MGFNNSEITFTCHVDNDSLKVLDPFHAKDTTPKEKHDKKYWKSRCKSAEAKIKLLCKSIDSKDERIAELQDALMEIQNICGGCIELPFYDGDDLVDMED